ALGDIKQRAHQPHHGPLGTFNWLTHALYKAHRTIRTNDTTFEIVKLSLMDDFIVALHCQGSIFGMNDALDKVLARQRSVHGIESQDAEYFIGPTSMACEHIDLVAPQVGDGLRLFELSFA